MKFKVISMTDNNYFDCGELFLKTRNKVNADYIVFSPDLSKENIKKLKDNNIRHVKIDKKEFENEMQFLKIKLLLSELKYNSLTNEYDMITFLDFDTFIINDWNKDVFSKDFDIGYTIRDDMIKKKCLRAFTNGGVIFVKPNSILLLSFIKDIILKGNDDRLIEYDEIWKTLEDSKRPIHKRHFRDKLRWWNDQIISSSFFYNYLKNNKYKSKTNFLIHKFEDYKIGFFNCDKYNVLDSDPIITKEKDIFIKHMKSGGRVKLTGKKDIVKEKI